MSISDDPRGFRRGQSNSSHQPQADGGRSDPRQPVRPDPRANSARQGYQPRQDDPYGSFAEGGDYIERQAPAPRQPSFSAFRPEAYAEPEKQDWRQPDPRAAEQRPATPRPQSGGGRPHDPYADISSDPYDTGRRDFGNDWNTDSFQSPQPNQFAASNYYTQHEDPHPAEAQSVHNRFFAAEPEPAPAPPPPPAPAPRQAPPPPPQAQRYRQDDYGAQDYAPEPQHYAPEPAPQAQPPQQRAAKPAPTSGGFEDDGYRWDNFDQDPAPESVRPFPNAKLGGGAPVPAPVHHQEDDLDADYFADEDEFEGEDDYAEPKRGGGKRLMAAVLVGAVVTGGGLAYLYKAGANGGNGETPILAADDRPIKERPTDPGGREFPNGSKLIYDRLDGANTAGAPADEPTRVASTGESRSDDVPGVVTTGASGSLEERIQTALQNAKRQDEPQAAANAPAASYDEPRRVRTEIFRPDGSVEASRPQRRQAPAEEASLASGPSRSAAAAAPAPRSISTQQFAAASPAPAAAPQANITTGGDAGMFVQIAARNDEAAAKAAFLDLKQKYAGVLGEHSPSVRKVDLGDKGVWYRLLVGPMPSKGDADKLCEDLKAAGMKGCFSRKE